MAKFIKQIHDVFADLEGKNIATKHPPEKIDRVLYLIIVDLFNKHYDNYVKTQKISNYLLPFKRQTTITLSGGLGDLPGDYAHKREVYFNGTNVPVTIVEDKFWANKVNSKLSPPSTSFPIGRIENTDADPPLRKIQVVPAATTILLHYFKIPREPKFAYDIVSNRYVYNDTDSIDMEFPIGLYPDIINRLLSAFGIVLREGQLIQVAEMLKSQEQVK